MDLGSSGSAAASNFTASPDDLPVTEFSTTGTPVDGDPLEALAARANSIFLQVMEMNLAYEEATAGTKAAKAKSGQVSG